MINRVIQHGKAEAQSALGSNEEIRTTLAGVARMDDFLKDLDAAERMLGATCESSGDAYRTQLPRPPQSCHGVAGSGAQVGERQIVALQPDAEHVVMRVRADVVGRLQW